MGCRVYSPNFINFYPWAIKWTGFFFGAEFRVVGTVFEPSSDELRVGLFLKSLFPEIVVYLENMFEVGFVPCLWLIWRSKLGRVGCRVNGTLPRQFLLKNSTKWGKWEPLAHYGVQQHATACSRQAAATLQRGITRYGLGIQASFPVLFASNFERL